MQRNPSVRNPSDDDVAIYWGYEDIVWFLVVAALLASASRLAIELGAHSSLVGRFRPMVQVTVVLLLVLALYLVFKLRHHRPVWTAIRWNWPSIPYALAAAVLGPALAAPAIAYSRYAHLAVPASASVPAIALGVVFGPFLEESFFRGCLLPVVARTVGKIAGVIIVAIVFTTFHWPPKPAQWAWFTIMGTAYGWMRVASGSTTAAALMHSSYNLTLLLATAV
jgi:membrane protease YdiL (CAAX protease family)